MNLLAVDGRGTAARRLLGVAAAVLLTVTGNPLAAQQPDSAPLPQNVVVDSILVQGAERQSSQEVVRVSGLDAGQRVDYRALQLAMRRLWASGQYEDVKIGARPSPAPDDETPHVILVLQVQEAPVVAQIDFHGLEHVKGSTVRDTVKLRRGEPLSAARVAAAEAMTRQLLAQEGFAAKVEHRIEPLPNQDHAVRLVFDVSEGRRVAIADVEFEGNEVFSDAQLADVLSTKREGFFWFREGTYDPETLREDLRARLPDFYGESGYIDFAVTGDSLAVDPTTGKARLIVRVNEGQQYVLADFDVQGNSRYSTEELKRYFDAEHSGLLSNLGLASGPKRVGDKPVFDATGFREATAEVEHLYSNSGYLYANVQPRVERVGETEDGHPAVDVAWVIQEGQPAYINRVIIEGNTVTHEQVIRDRIVLLPGDVYSEDRLIQSYRAISSLGFFQTPMPLPRMEPTEDGDVNITFQVEEKQTGSVNFGTAIGGGAYGISGFLGYDQPNLFGKAKSGHVRWEFGKWSNNFEASYSDPSIMDTRLSGSASLFSSRDRFISFNEGQRRRTGVGFRVGYPFPLDPRWTRFYVGYSVSKTSYEESSGTSGSIFSQPDAVQSALSTGLLRNTLDHPLFPTIGSRQSLDLEFDGGPLGGDGNYQKYEASGSWFVPVGTLGGSEPGSRPIRFTLGLTTEAGAIFGDVSRFPFERYWMGGVQFGRPLRGYEETTITPAGYLARGSGSLQDRLGDAYFRLSAEYDMRFNDNLSLGVFYDAGNLWTDPSNIDPTRLLRGSGVDLMLVTPFGPIGIDYAYGFDKTVPGWQLHFKFGQMF